MQKYAELKNQIVLITGGTQGIGEAMADAFAAQGCKLAINGRALNDKVRKVADRTNALPVMGSISEPGVASRIVEETIAEYGKLDVLVCNAAGMDMKPFLEHPEEKWWPQVNINLSGHFECVRTALPDQLVFWNPWLEQRLRLWGVQIRLAGHGPVSCQRAPQRRGECMHHCAGGHPHRPASG